MENLNIPKLDARLMSAASMVTGDTVADIGTDHAYIPIYLLNTGKCSRAVAADINKGPLDNAKENAAAFGAADKISFYLADGTRGVDLTGVTDIVICGMGGELEARIVSECARARDGVRFVLQPMSAVHKLREFLYSERYEITDGAVSVSGGKVYQCIACRFTGCAPRTLTPTEALVGTADEPLRGHPLYPRLLEKYIKKAEKELAGRRAGGLDTDAAEKLLTELMNIYDTCK